MNPLNLLQAEQAGDWIDRASCVGLDQSLFFPPSCRHVTQTVRELCGACPVRQACFDYAKRTFQPAGVWGGVAVKQHGAVRQAHAQRKVT